MNIYDYACSVQDMFFKSQLYNFGYESFTTFYADLTIGECSGGIKGVKNIIKDIEKFWLDDYKFFTEFIMAINWKQFEMKYRLDKGVQVPNAQTKDYMDLYCNEFIRLRDLFLDHYKDNDEALNYYFRATD